MWVRQDVRLSGSVNKKEIIEEDLIIIVGSDATGCWGFKIVLSSIKPGLDQARKVKTEEC